MAAAIRLDPGVGSLSARGSADTTTTGTSPGIDSLRDRCFGSTGHTYIFISHGRGSLEHGDTGNPDIGTDRLCT